MLNDNNEISKIKIETKENLKKDEVNLFLKQMQQEIIEDSKFNFFSPIIKQQIEDTQITNKDESNNPLFSFLMYDLKIIGVFYFDPIKNKPLNESIFFMILKDFRGKGLGKKGFHLFLNYLKMKYPNIDELYFTYEKDKLIKNLILFGNNGIIKQINEKEYISILNGNKIWIHKILMSDMPQILAITDSAKKLLKQNGSLQWQQGYPNEETFTNDIKNGNLFGLYENEKLLGYAAYLKGIDENYVEIDGKWNIKANENDLSIHRIAVEENSHKKKYGNKLIEYGIWHARKLNCISVKIDTHKNNIPMQKCISQTGFVYKGIIKILRDKLDFLRNAYEIDL